MGKREGRMANSADPDQTRGAVLSGSTLFAQGYLSENLRKLLFFLFYIGITATVQYSDHPYRKREYGIGRERESREEEEGKDQCRLCIKGTGMYFFFL